MKPMQKIYYLMLLGYLISILSFFIGATLKGINLYYGLGNLLMWAFAIILTQNGKI